VAADDDREGPTYGQYCPISRALDVVGERWSLLILRDMILGTTRFNDLARGLPKLSRTLLSKRLRQFERAGLVERREGEYELTEAGRRLEPVVFGLGEWGARYAFADPTPEELDAELLVWWVHGRLDTSCWPGGRHVIQVRFRDDRRTYWIVVEDGTPSVCTSDPGYEVDVSLRADVSTMYQVWLGRRDLTEALRDGRIEVVGRPALVRTMPQVMRLSPIAPAVRGAR